MTWTIINADARQIPMADKSVECVDAAYLAGIIDGEGYIGIKRMQPKNMKSVAYRARIQVRMTDEPAIKFLRDTLGGMYYRERQSKKGRKILYCYQVSDRAAESVLWSVINYLRVKRKQAELVLEFRDLQRSASQYRTKIIGQRNFPNLYGNRVIQTRAHSDKYVAKCHEFYEQCKRLNRVGDGGDALCG